MSELEGMSPIERIYHELGLIEWGSEDGELEGCPSCGRSKAGHGGRHAYGCSIRTIYDQLLLVEYDSIPEDF